MKIVFQVERFDQWAIRGTISSLKHNHGERLGTMSLVPSDYCQAIPKHTKVIIKFKYNNGIVIVLNVKLIKINSRELTSILVCSSSRRWVIENLVDDNFFNFY